MSLNRIQRLCLNYLSWKDAFQGRIELNSSIVALFLGGLISLVLAFFSKDGNSVFMFGLGLILFAWFLIFFCLNNRGENYFNQGSVLIFSLLFGGGYLFALISRIVLSRWVYWFGIFVLIISAIILLLEIMEIYAQRVIRNLMAPGSSDEDFVFTGYENL